MRRGIRYLSFTFLIAATFAVSTVAQNAGEWTSLSGKNNEFVVCIPAGYLTGGQTSYVIPTENKRYEIGAHIIVARLFGRTLLRHDVYEGDVKGLETLLIGDHKMTDAKVVGPFTFSSLSTVEKGRLHRYEFYNNGKRLYVVQSDGPEKDDSVRDPFFASVRIKADGGMSDPHIPGGDAKIKLPVLVEAPMERVDDTHLFDIKDVDRPPLILFAPRLNWSNDSRHGVGAGEIAIKVLYSSSGVVTKTEVGTSNFLNMSQAARDAAKKMIFIPAEKDGKLVSVYGSFTNYFEIRKP